MLKYLVVLLDDTSTSFCHYTNPCVSKKLIPLDDLHKGIIWSMKENVNVQFVYPNYTLPPEYLKEIDTVDHVDIFPKSEKVVCLREGDMETILLRYTKQELFTDYQVIKDYFDQRVNVVITDIESFTDDDYTTYRQVLKDLSDDLIKRYGEGKQPQLNLLTDRLALEKMNNCNAGWESITLAPDGKFYVCPAYYIEGKEPVGSPAEGVQVLNAQLYHLDHAPICRICDAYQCHRCIWLNECLTGEVNTPSKQQCMVVHIERNASRELLLELHTLGIANEREIKEIDYLDPFEKIRR